MGRWCALDVEAVNKDVQDTTQLTTPIRRRPNLRAGYEADHRDSLLNAPSHEMHSLRHITETGTAARRT